MLAGVSAEPADPRTRSQKVTHAVFGVGGGVASVVYGTVVVMATVTAAYATETHPWKLTLLVWITVLVLWIAHLYAHGLSHSLEHRRTLGRADALGIAQREIGILVAAAAPTAALLLGAAGIMHESAAIWLALATGLVILGVEGIRYARLEDFGTTATVVAVCLNVALGLFVVALKVLVAH